MVLLIPGKLWDSAMANLGPKNPILLREGVQIMNAKWEGNAYTYELKYDIHNPADFTKWLREALNNPDFKRAQNVETKAPEPTAFPSSSPASHPSHPISPLMSNIVRPARTHPRITSTSKAVIEIDGDVCRMKIISRPR